MKSKNNNLVLNEHYSRAETGSDEIKLLKPSSFSKTEPKRRHRLFLLIFSSFIRGPELGLS